MIRSEPTTSKYDFAEREGWIYDTTSSDGKAKIHGHIDMALARTLHKMTEFEYLSRFHENGMLTGRLLKYYETIRGKEEDVSSH